MLELGRTHVKVLYQYQLLMPDGIVVVQNQEGSNQSIVYLESGFEPRKI